jgi:metal-dependent HD superfamily phosphatase/phosphodiesterase
MTKTNRNRIFNRTEVSAQEFLEPNTKALEMYQYLSTTPKVKSYLKAANRMAVSRLGYTDHGLVHAEVATWNAIQAFDILDKTFQPNVVAEGLGDTDDARLVVIATTYLHDLGMTVHRTEHSQAALQLAAPIIERKLDGIYDSPAKVADIMSFILHGIYAHDDNTQCLTLEAGCTKIGDGCDMTKGRTKGLMNAGKVDVHSVSANAIEDVFLEEGKDKPLLIVVAMENPAGVFQVEAVLGKKLTTSGLQEHVGIEVLVNGERLILSQVRRLHRDLQEDLREEAVSLLEGE